jgi:hypothetical protein
MVRLLVPFVSRSAAGCVPGELSAARDKMSGQDRIGRELAEADWITDCSFLEHLAIGVSGELCVLVHRSTWETDQPAYEPYDAGLHISCWVHEIPTPERAAMLLEEHGETPEER